MERSTKKIGFLGLGAMGFPIAYGLYKAGCAMVLPSYRPLSSHGFSPIAPDLASKTARMGEMLGSTAEGASSQADLIAKSDILMLSLPTSKEVEATMLGPDGVLANIRPGGIVIDLTSADPESTRRLNSLLEGKGAFLLDAPVSGGTVGASRQTLSVMVGGRQEIFEECRPILETLGAPEKVRYIGPSGAGDTIKCANNFLSCCCLAATTEALAVCARAGIDPRTAAGLINSSGGGSNATAFKYPSLIFPGKDLGITVRLMRKDLNLFLEAGKKYDIPTFLGDTTYQLWNLPVAEGKGDMDQSCVIEMYERLCDIHLRGLEACE